MHSYWYNMRDGLCGLARTGGWGGGIMMLIGLLLLAAIIYLLFRRKDSSGGNGREDSPLELLQKRYVNGEISKEEYEEKKRVLKGT